MIPDEQTQLRLYTLGRWHVQVERRIPQSDTTAWEPLHHVALQQERIHKLLVCLVSAPGRSLSREQAKAIIWPELDQETANHRLDRAIHTLRQIFAPLALSHVLVTCWDPETRQNLLTLVDQTQLWIDADAFESCLIEAQQTPDPALAERLLESAAQLYLGDFLDAAPLQTELVEDRRRALRRHWAKLMLAMADARITQQALPEAVALLYRLVLMDSTNEAAIKRLMTLFSHVGRFEMVPSPAAKLTEMIQQNLAMVPLPTAYLPDRCPFCAAPLLAMLPDARVFVDSHDDRVFGHRCSRCHILYEFSYSLTQVSAISPDGERLERIRRCLRCHQLYRDDVGHTCVEEEH